MSQLFTAGRVTSDLKLKKSEKQTDYVSFFLAEKLGYGKTARFQSFQVWAWGADARALVARKVGKGSQIWVTGTVELRAFQRADGTKDKGMKLCLNNWDFASEAAPNGAVEIPVVPRAGTTADEAEQDRPAPPGVIDGDRDTLPE